MTIEDVRTLRLLARLSPGVREQILKLSNEVSYQAGQRIFLADEPARGCWIISSGHVALDLPVPGRGDVTVQTLGPGDMLGWSWLIPPCRWQFGARAIDDVAGVRLDTARLKVMADRDPAFGYELVLTLFEAVTHRLQATRARLLNLYDNPAGIRG